MQLHGGQPVLQGGEVLQHHAVVLALPGVLGEGLLDMQDPTSHQGVQAHQALGGDLTEATHAGQGQFAHLDPAADQLRVVDQVGGHA
ncbi:hypothetical protein D9M71_836070 [compost metagenome]